MCDIDSDLYGYREMRETDSRIIFPSNDTIFSRRLASVECTVHIQSLWYGVIPKWLALRVRSDSRLMPMTHLPEIVTENLYQKTRTGF